MGIKSRLAGGAFEWELTAFQMDFENLVVAQSVDGLPSLINAGSERFKGAELELKGRLGGLHGDCWWQASYAWHDAKYRDLVEELDGENVQLAGNRLQLSAHNLVSAGLVYSPAHGFFGSLTANYMGSRVLDEQNEILAPSYTTCLGRHRLPLRPLAGPPRRPEPQRHAPAGLAERARRRPVLPVARAHLPTRPRFSLLRAEGGPQAPRRCERGALFGAGAPEFCGNLWGDPLPRRLRMKKDFDFEQRPMVDWMAPGQLAQTGIKAVVSDIFGSYADKRDVMAALDPDPELDDKFATADELWIDYVADLGDGFDSTYTMARLLAAPRLSVAARRARPTTSPADRSW